MITLGLTRIQKAPRPMGNPFKVRAIWQTNYQFTRKVGTGVHIDVPEGMILHVESIAPGVVVLGHEMTEKELVVIVHAPYQDVWSLSPDKDFASVTILEVPVPTVRFAEMGEGGGRMTTGSPEKIHESSDAKKG
jgi:hypothetical protein